MARDDGAGHEDGHLPPVHREVRPVGTVIVSVDDMLRSRGLDIAIGPLRSRHVREGWGVGAGGNVGVTKQRPRHIHGHLVP